MNSETIDSGNLEAALSHAQNGMKIVPVRPNKAPYIKDWPNSGTVDESIIERWWSKWPDAMPGLPCGSNGLIVVDCDIRENVNGVEVWHHEARSRDFPLNNCPVVITPSGGQHYYYRQRKDQLLKNSSNKIAEGIDTRGDGGYVVAPGAILPDGRKYELVSGSLLSTPEIRQDLSDFLYKPATKTSNPQLITESELHKNNAIAILNDAVAKVRSATVGERNTTLNNATFSIAKLIPLGSISRHEIEVALTDAARLAGLDDKEISATLKSAIDSGMSDTGAQPPITEWQTPMPLPSELLPVQKFDPTTLPQPVRGWCEDIAHRMQCPVDFIAVPAFIALGATIGNQIGIRPKQNDDWFVTPNLWGCIVGTPGTMKSPALSQALAPLNSLQTAADIQYKQEMFDYGEQKYEFDLRDSAYKAKAKKDLKTNPEGDLSTPPEQTKEPTLKRYMLGDATYEATAEALFHNPNGLLVYRDELLSLIKPLDREENSAARGFYLTAWNGTDSYTFDRIIRGIQHIDRTSLSILGSTQPEKLTAYLDRIGRDGNMNDGLIQRIQLLAWPDPLKEWEYVDRVPNKEAQQQASEVFNKLSNIKAFNTSFSIDTKNDYRYLKFSHDAGLRFAEWYAENQKLIRSGKLSPMMEGHFSKYRKLVPAIALIIHLTEGMEGDVTISAINRAIAFAGYLESHAYRIFDTKTRLEVAAAKLLIERIKRCDISNGFTLRDIQQRGWSGLKDHSQLEAGLELLIRHQWLFAQSVNTGGRPTVRYYINPAIDSG